MPVENTQVIYIYIMNRKSCSIFAVFLGGHICKHTAFLLLYSTCTWAKQDIPVKEYFSYYKWFPGGVFCQYSKVTDGTFNSPGHSLGIFFFPSHLVKCLLKRRKAFSVEGWLALGGIFWKVLLFGTGRCLQKLKRQQSSLILEETCAKYFSFSL